MAVSRTVMRSVASIADLAARVREANRLLSVENAEGMFVTMFHGVLYLGTGALAYCNAGHNPPYLLRAEGTDILHPTGPAFGLDADMGYRIEERLLSPGDALFLFTDGVTEALNRVNDEFGAERLEAVLAAARGHGARALVANGRSGSVAIDISATLVRSRTAKVKSRSVFAIL